MLTIRNYTTARDWAASVSYWHAVAWAYFCARSVLAVFERESPEHDSPRIALRIVRRWLCGDRVEIAELVDISTRRSQELLRERYSIGPSYGSGRAGASAMWSAATAYAVSADKPHSTWMNVGHMAVIDAAVAAGYGASDAVIDAAVAAGYGASDAISHVYRTSESTSWASVDRVAQRVAKLHVPYAWLARHAPERAKIEVVARGLAGEPAARRALETGESAAMAAIADLAARLDVDGRGLGTDLLATPNPDALMVILDLAIERGIVGSPS